MKKLFVLTASMLALSAGGAYAQVQTSVIFQNGMNNEANVDQTGGEEGLSDIDQNGDDNLAEVTQTEDPTPGSNSFGTAANSATINQVGDMSRARIEQNSKNPGGNSNVATIDQTSSFDISGPDSTVPSGFANN